MQTFFENQLKLILLTSWRFSSQLISPNSFNCSFIKVGVDPHFHDSIKLFRLLVGHMQSSGNTLVCCILPNPLFLYFPEISKFEHVSYSLYLTMKKLSFLSNISVHMWQGFFDMFVPLITTLRSSFELKQNDNSVVNTEIHSIKPPFFKTI